LALRDYLMGYTEHHKIDHSLIRLNTTVKNVIYHEDTKKFEVTAKDAANEYKEHFDYVIVSSGHFSRPNMPEFKGLDQYSGLTLHSHDFRTGESFKGQTVAVVGGSYSAEDVASQLFKFGAKNTIITHRKKDAAGNWAAKGFKWPKGIEERPLMTNIEGNKITFGDNSVEEVDSVILCTGYKHYFSFLDKKINLECLNRIYTPELIHNCISKQNDKLFFLGM
jgi:trimethylamine monooxygenase